MARLFLAIVGVAYISLAAWCAVSPKQTSQFVGFTLTPGSGQSEFLVVYGGLELALGIIFLWPIWRPHETAFALLACLIIHGCLVLFRTASFLLFQDIAAGTYGLAATEWIIFLAAGGLWWTLPANH